MLANLPLEFEPNEGQGPRLARFVAQGIDLNASLRPTGIDLSLGGLQRERAAIALDFVGANPHTKIVASEEEKSYTNYLLGKNPSGWLRHVANFGRVTFQGIYSGIDAAFYGNGHFLEHDFIVTPGADYRQIRIRIEGANSIHLLRDGNLRLSLEHGTVTFKRPKTYQFVRGSKRNRQSGFVVLGKDEIGFSVGRYDPTKTLIIDPVLVYSTYLAGVPVDMAGVATNSAGDTFLTGLTYSSTFPTTAGAYQTACASCGSSTQEPDVFVAKINATGTALVYSTFLGGSSYDQPYRIAVDGTGNAVVVGRTESADFPVKNPVPVGTTANGTYYGFITSLSPDGSALNYSSILGGGNQTSPGPDTSVFAVALDSNGNAYITGITDSPAFPTTAGALDNVAPNYPNNVGFVTKFLPTGALGYSALIGDTTPQNPGAGLIGVFGIAVDPADNAYITGSAGTLWPTTSGAYQTTIPGTAPYAAPFVTKLSPDGSSLVYSTFVGSAGQPTGIAVEANTGQAFITGVQAPTNFPTTPNAFLTSIGNVSASFLTEFSADGSSLVYSTFVAPDPATDGSTTSTTGIALDSSDNIWLVGTTNSSQFPLKYPLQSLPAGPSPTTTAFISRFDPTGTTLTFSSYFGGTVQGGTIVGIAIDSLDQAHVAGTTGDGLFTTSGAYLASVPPPPSDVEYTYGYAAVIDANTAGPSACFSPQSVVWGNVLVGTSASETLTITNCGNAALTISSVQSSSPLFTIPSATNGCQQSAAAGASCTMDIVYTPAAVETDSATLTIDSNAPVSTNSLSLEGNGAAPQISVQPTSFTFDPQFIGQTSPEQVVTITNTGNWPLAIDLSQTTVSTGFAYTQSGCGQSLGTQASCYIFLTFTPESAGTLTGTLNIASDDPNHPVVSVALSGTGYSSYPVPTLTGLSLPTIQVGSTGVSLTVTGTNFFPASVVVVGGAAQPTTYNSSTSLTATVDPSLLTNMGELQVTVFNPSPGGGTTSPMTVTVYESIPLDAKAMVYNPVSGLLFASIGASATNNPNTVAVIDPVAGKVSQYIPVGNNPNRLAISGDGQYLYVSLDGDHAIQRINLTSLSVDDTFALPVDPSFGQLTVADMKVVPGSPQTVVAALFMNASPPEDGIALFNSGGLVNWLANDYADGYVEVDSFAFVGNPPVVYSFPLTAGSPGTFGVFTIDNSGIHVQTTGTSGTTQQQTGDLLASDGTLLYTNSGEVWNPPSNLVGTYNPSLFYAPSVVPDDSDGRTFFINPNGTANQTGATSIDAYDQKSFDLAGSVPFLSTVVYGPDAVALNRWGTDGFAFLVDDFVQTTGSGHLLLFRSSIANPGSGTNPAPVLSALSPSSVVAGSPGFVLGMQGSSFISSSVVEWNGSPLGTTFVNSSQLKADIPATDIAQTGTAQVTVVNPAPGGGTSSALPLTILSASGAVTLQPATLAFGSQTVGTQSAAQSVTLQNSGGSALTMTSIQDSGDFSETNDCPASLASLATCTISVTFKPTATGTRQGAITITDSAADSPQTVTLSGTGNGPIASLAPTSLKFGGQLVGAANAAQQVKLTNSGNSALSISAIATTGDFAETNNCGTSLAAGASCLVSVTFEPTASGTRTGSLSFTDNATGSPQSVAMSGTGEDFTVGIASGSSSTATVTAGGTATYAVSVTPEGGFNQAVSIACSGAPSLATCTASPASVAPDGTNPAQVNITVTTTAASAMPPGPAPARPFTREKFLLLGVGLVFLAILASLARPQPRRTWLGLALALAMIGMLAACGGSGPTSSTTGGGSHTAGTPAGTYSLTVSGSDGSLTHSTTLTLTVQ
jgi:hypothetical protein